MKFLGKWGLKRYFVERNEPIFNNKSWIRACIKTEYKSYPNSKQILEKNYVFYKIFKKIWYAENNNGFKYVSYLTMSLLISLVLLLLIINAHNFQLFLIFWQIHEFQTVNNIILINTNH